MTSPSEFENIADNVAFLQQRMASLAKNAGRPAQEVRLVGVSKTQDWPRVQAAIQAGVGIIGENRWQEARDKLPADWVALAPGTTAVADCPRAAIHFIGHLQKNKVRKAVGFFDCIQSIDDAETLDLASQEAQALGKTLDILFEVNTSGEESKQGLRDRDGLFRLIEHGLKLPSLNLRGLMTIGPLGGDETAIRRAFAGLREDLRLAAEGFGLPASWSELSMGMSGDYHWAIAEGSTLVRIGTALFGPRLAGPGSATHGGQESQ